MYRAHSPREKVNEISSMADVSSGALKLHQKDIVMQEFQTVELLKCLWYSKNKKKTNKKTPSGLADVDTPFITHITGEPTDGGKSLQERPHLLRPEAYYKGSLTKEACVLFVTLYCIAPVCTCRKKKSRSSHRTRCCSQKEIRRELHNHLQNNTHSFR